MSLPPLPQRPYFITLEGSEGAGKSTAIRFLKTYLEQSGADVLLTREPGGTPLAEDIRSLLLEKRSEIVEPDTELLMMFAARVQHVQQVIKPALASNHWVICDRFTDATFAYQGGGRGLAWQRIEQLENWTLNGFKPDLTLLMDLPVEIGLARAAERGDADRFESENIAFFERVRAGYQRRMKDDPNRIRLIDAAQPIASVESQIVSVCREWITEQCQLAQTDN